VTSERHFDNNKISARILLALGFGLAFGLALNVTIAEQEWVSTWLIHGVFHVVGEAFIRLLSMLIVPLVFVSLVNGVSSLSDPARFGRISAMSLALYMLTTGIAVVVALSAAFLFQPGVGASPENVVARAIAPLPPFTQVLIDMVPRNPVEAMATGAMLPIILFSILLGLSMAFSGQRGARIAAIFEDFNVVILRLVSLVMTFAPYGVFALVASMAATTGWGTFLGVFKYVVLVFCVLIFHAAVVYPALLLTMTGLNPVIFYLKMRDVITFAFSTASSGATIPITLRTVQERLGVSNKVSSFTVPLGATINMDGTAIMQGIATGFIAQYYGIDLTVAQYLTVVMMVIIASIGTAGVPGVGLVLLAGVLTQVGLPVEGIALILGVDRLLDMTRTAVNVCGDSIVTLIVARAENEHDVSAFNDSEAGRNQPTLSA